MKRIALVIAIASLVGCAHGGRSERVDGQDLQQQLQAYIDDYVDQVLDQCIELHGMAQSGESPVDCAFQGDLSAMHLSLPSIEYHDAHLDDIAQMEQNWCAAAQSKLGHPVRWVRHFRKEKAKLSRPCYKDDMLRRLRVSGQR